MTLVNRQVVAALALVGLFISIYMLMYNLGVLPAVVCGEGGGCEIVQASRWAYFLGVPVAGWGTLGYLAIFLVALVGARPGAADDRRVAWALLALTGVAFLFSLYLSALEQWVIGAWCRWCVGSAVVATLAFLAALPEMRRIRGRAA